MYSKTLAKLAAIVHDEDKEQLLDIFAREEESNFAIYRYIQNINNEREQLNDARTCILHEQEAYDSFWRHI